MKNQKSAIALAVFVTFLVTSAMYVGAFVMFPDAHTTVRSFRNAILPFGQGGGVLSELEQVVSENYFEETDTDKLTESALKGYVSALEDPYSQYYTKEEYLEATTDLTGNYKGIGVVVSATEDNKIRVETVYEGSPAEEAGILEGDILAKVEDKSYTGELLNEAVAAIKTAEDDAPPIKLTMLRNGEHIEVMVERREVSVDVVDTQMLEDNIGYIEFTQFTEGANEEFRTGVNELMSSGAESIIIDLRGNPGGLLLTVLDIADLLLPEGKILTTKGRNTEEEVYMSGETFVDIPLYVLINGGSASASEVLAGALKDHDRAVLIGETTFGKGLVQNMLELSDGSAVKLTISKYYTPSGTCIDGTGIEPDYKVEWRPEEGYVYSMDTDPQLRKAIELAKEGK